MKRLRGLKGGLLFSQKTFSFIFYMLCPRKQGLPYSLFNCTLPQCLLEKSNSSVLIKCRRPFRRTIREYIIKSNLKSVSSSDKFTLHSKGTNPVHWFHSAHTMWVTMLLTSCELNDSFLTRPNNSLDVMTVQCTRSIQMSWDSGLYY